MIDYAHLFSGLALTSFVAAAIIGAEDDLSTHFLVYGWIFMFDAGLITWLS